MRTANCFIPATVDDQADSAYYYVKDASWKLTTSNYTMNKSASALGLKENDSFSVTIVAVPEYYETDGPLSAEDIAELLDSGALGDGVCLTTNLTVDDTAPVLTGVSKDLLTGDLTITAEDNQYIAYVAVLNKSGKKLFNGSAVEQTAPGTEASVTIDLKG